MASGVVGVLGGGEESAFQERGGLTQEEAEEVNVGEFWNGDDMVVMDDDEGDGNELANFKVVWCREIKTISE